MLRISPRRLAATLVGAVVLVVPVAPVAPAASPGGSSGHHGLDLLADEQLSADGRLHELTLRSDALGGTTKVRLLLPGGYDDPAQALRRYPVLVLLHGAGGDETSWTEMTDLAGHSAGLDLIVVMPDGGETGFYSDWIDGPAWESFHIGELVPWVDASFRTTATRQGRGVAGLSMGGYGAIVYAARHPDLFVSAASFSGALDIADGGPVEAATLEALGFGDDRRWGPYLTDEARWRGHNPADLAPNLRSTRVRATTGTGAACPGDRPESGTLEAGVFLMTTAFRSRMQLAAAPMELEVRPCGTHEWHYWDRDLAAWLPGLMGTFDTPPAPPNAFDYRSVEPAFSVWGWGFEVDRAAVEFLELRGVSGSGLSATGSGRVHVISPGVYEPGRTYLLTAASGGTLTVPVGLAPSLGPVPGATPGPTASVVADGDRRLRFAIDLGPAHTANQYSPEGIAAEAAEPGSYFRTATVAIASAQGQGASPSSAAPAPGRESSGSSGSSGSGVAAPADRLPATGAGPAVAPWLLVLAAIAGLCARRALVRAGSLSHAPG